MQNGLKRLVAFVPWILPGMTLWVALLAGHAAEWLRLGLIDLLLAFGLAFVVPLNLGWFLGPERAKRWMSTIPITAAIAIGSFSISSGALAAGLAMPWLVVSLWIGSKQLLRLWSRRSLHPTHLLPAAVGVYLVVGAFWLVVSRYGARPMGLSADIVELTAVHFHFAGFAAPLFAIATGKLLEARGSPKMAAVARVAGLGVVAAMPVVAIGFFAPQIVTAVGASMLALSLWVLAAVMIPAAGRLSVVPRILLTIAALSVFGSMSLALHYAVGPLLGMETLSIPRMAELHGMANAFGFSSCATLAFVLASSNESLGVRQ